MNPAAARTIHAASVDELEASTLYAMLRLRVDVFVVEQACPYPDLDGRDTEADAQHWWVEEGGEPVCYLRLLTEPDGASRIGRVVTRPAARGAGLAATLLRRALASERCRRPVHLGAQAHLADWYASFGFRVVGPVYDEDGIPHVPMTLG